MKERRRTPGTADRRTRRYCSSMKDDHDLATNLALAAAVDAAWDFDDPVAAHAFPDAGLRRLQLEVVDAWGMTGRVLREVVEADSGGLS